MWTVHCPNLVFIVFVFLPFIVKGIPDYSGLPAGPYCASRYPGGSCCPGRQDECSAPILTTLCYCDDFCDRSREEDCCPDYWYHCRGIVPNVTSPPEEIRSVYIFKMYIKIYDLLCIYNMHNKKKLNLFTRKINFKEIS